MNERNKLMPYVIVDKDEYSILVYQTQSKYAPARRQGINQLRQR